LYFNLSHSGNWVLLGLSDSTIGVDVEQVRRINFNIARRFFSSRECEDLFSISDINNRTDYFFTLWSLKESYIKAEGMGLSIPLDSFSIIKSTSGRKNTYNVIGEKLGDSYDLKCYPNIDKEYKFSACFTKEEEIENITILKIEQIEKLLRNISPISV